MAHCFSVPLRLSHPPRLPRGYHCLHRVPSPEAPIATDPAANSTSERRFRYWTAESSIARNDGNHSATRPIANTTTATARNAGPTPSVCTAGPTST